MISAKNITLIIILAIIIIVGGCLGWKYLQEESLQTANTNQTSSQENLIDNTISGNLKFTLAEVQVLGNILRISDGIPGQYCVKDKQATGKFIKIKLKVENIGEKAGNPQVVVIVDSAGKIFDVGDFPCWVSQEEQIIQGYHLMQPGDSKLFTLIADVPVDSRGLKLSVIDNPYEETIYEKLNKFVNIDLGI